MEKWYEPLIKEEFIDYFSNEENNFYTIVDGKVFKEPIFQNFSDVVKGITHALNSVRNPEIFEFDNDLSSTMPPYMYMGFKKAYDGLTSEGKNPEDFFSIRPNGLSISPYELDPMSLSADRITMLILYPFWSRMGGSFETTFLDDGRLKKYLLALKKKHLEEIYE